MKEVQDWWENISDQEKLAIDKGITQLDNGESISHESLKSEILAKHLLITKS